MGGSVLKKLHVRWKISISKPVKIKHEHALKQWPGSQVGLWFCPTHICMCFRVPWCINKQLPPSQSSVHMGIISSHYRPFNNNHRHQKWISPSMWYSYSQYHRLSGSYYQRCELIRRFISFQLSQRDRHGLWTAAYYCLFCGAKCCLSCVHLSISVWDKSHNRNVTLELTGSKH